MNNRRALPVVLPPLLLLGGLLAGCAVHTRSSAPGAPLAPPPIGETSSKSDVGNFVKYFHDRGFVVTENTARFAPDGKIESFRYHAHDNGGNADVAVTVDRAHHKSLTSLNQDNGWSFDLKAGS